MVAVKDTIHQRLDRLKYVYQLLFNMDKIEIPTDISESEKNKYIKKVYRDKAKIHEKLGAKRFQKFVKKFDKAKFKVIKHFIKEKRLINWSDKVTEYNAKQALKLAKTDEEKKTIIENMKRGKILVRKQLKEERSINYYQGVDKRIENFDKYINKNKEIHKNALKINGLLLVASVGLGVAGVPVIPFVLGGYQILAGFKNFQCVNAQNYYLSIMNMRRKAIVRKNLTEIKKTYEENPDLIASIKKGLEEGKELDSKQGLLDSINTVEGLQQLKTMLMASRKEQATVMKRTKVKTSRETEAMLESMITPPENPKKIETAKVAVKK